MRRISNETLGKLLLTKEIAHDEIEEVEEIDQHPLFAQTEALKNAADAIVNLSVQSDKNMAQLLSKIVHLIDQQNKVIEIMSKKIATKNNIMYFDIQKGSDGRVARVIPVREDR